MMTQHYVARNTRSTDSSSLLVAMLGALRTLRAGAAPQRPLARLFATSRSQGRGSAPTQGRANDSKSQKKVTLIDTLRERSVSRRAGLATGIPPETRELNMQLLQNVLKKGKRATAEKLVKQGLLQLREQSGVNPLEAVHEAVLSAAPLVNTKSRRAGGSRVIVPIQVTPRRSRRMAIRWMMGSNRSPKPRMANRISNEINDVLHSRGTALQRRDEIYKAVNENRGQARF